MDESQANRAQSSVGSQSQHRLIVAGILLGLAALAVVVTMAYLPQRNRSVLDQIVKVNEPVDEQEVLPVDHGTIDLGGLSAPYVLAAADENYYQRTPKLVLLDTQGKQTTIDDAFGEGQDTIAATIDHGSLWYVRDDTLFQVTTLDSRKASIGTYPWQSEGKSVVDLIKVPEKPWLIAYLVPEETWEKVELQLIDLESGANRVVASSDQMEFAPYASDFHWLGSQLLVFSTGYGDAGCGFSKQYTLELQNPENFPDVTAYGPYVDVEYSSCQSDFEQSGSLLYQSVPIDDFSELVVKDELQYDVAEGDSERTLGKDDFLNARDWGTLHVLSADRSKGRTQAVNFSQFIVVETFANQVSETPSTLSVLGTAVREVRTRGIAPYIRVEKGKESVYFDETGADGYYRLEGDKWAPVAQADFEALPASPNAGLEVTISGRQFSLTHWYDNEQQGLALRNRATGEETRFATGNYAMKGIVGQ